MAKVYADLIRKGLKTIDEVPDKIRAEVEALLNAQAINNFFTTQEGGRDHGSYLCNSYRKRQEDIYTGSR